MPQMCVNRLLSTSAMAHRNQRHRLHQHGLTEDNDDELLVQYIATHNRPKAGRSGNRLYQILVDDVRVLPILPVHSLEVILTGARQAQKCWPWAKRHSWKSWRDRYTKDVHNFDKKIAACIAQENAMKPPHRTKRKNESADETVYSDRAKTPRKKKIRTNFQSSCGTQTSTPSQQVTELECEEGLGNNTPPVDTTVSLPSPHRYW
jgi:hypothetical protein